MSKLVQKWKKALSGSCNKNKESLIENDFLQPTHMSNDTDEFHFIKTNNNYNDNNNNVQKIFPIYNDYDNLQHQMLPKYLSNQSNNTNSHGSRDQRPLKDSTNTALTNSRCLMRAFLPQKSSDTKQLTQKDQDKNNKKFNYCELYDQNDLYLPHQHQQQLAQQAIKRKSDVIDDGLNLKIANNLIDENDYKNSNDLYYCEIPETDNLIYEKSRQKENRKISDSKVNLFNKFEIDEHPVELINKSQNLTSLRDLKSFSNQREAFHWYLNLINDTITNCIQRDKQLGEQDISKRLNICQAHFLYAKNFYEMRINNSQQFKSQLTNMHPCLIALACLLDSDAVRIIESHTCACDTYIYLFSTRLKFCAWKSKLYIILKKPKRSSIDRLNLIEDLTNCHKLIQDKTNNNSNS